MGPLALLALAGAPEDEGWEDADEAGWADAPPPLAPAAPPSPWSAGARLRSQAAFRLEPEGGPPLAKARLSVDPWLGWTRGPWQADLSLRAEADLAVLLQPDAWDAATREDYGALAQLRRASVTRAAGPWVLTAGRQPVATGEGLLISHLDVFSPMDLREPGLTPLDELRLPTTALRLGHARGPHTVEAALLPESHAGLRSPPKGPFGMLPGLLSDPETAASVGHLVDLDALAEGLIVDWDHSPRPWSPSAWQGYARWRRRGPGLDLSLLAGLALDQRGVLVTPPLDDLLTAANLGEPTTIGLEHRRFWLLGHSGAAPAGPLILRWELAWNPNAPVNVGEGLTTRGMAPVLDVHVDTVNVARGLVGLSWQGWGHTRVDLDLAQSLSPDPPWLPLFPVTNGAWALRVGKALWRERLSLEALAMGWGWTAQYGALVRARAELELADALDLELGWIHYRPGVDPGPLLGLDHHDRLFIGLTWSWQARPPAQATQRPR